MLYGPLYNFKKTEGIISQTIISYSSKDNIAIPIN